MIKTKLKFTKFDKDFQRLSQFEQPSRSWLKGMWYWLYLQNSHTNLTGCIDISNTSRELRGMEDSYAYGVGWAQVSVGGGAGGVASPFYVMGNSYPINRPNDLAGIVIGSNNAAVTPSQYALAGGIRHGATAGCILYGGCEVVNPTFADPNGEMIIRRFFTNVSGGDITVQEAGIYHVLCVQTDWSRQFCIARDVVAPAVVVADTEILMVTYTVQIVV